MLSKHLSCKPVPKTVKRKGIIYARNITIEIQGTGLKNLKWCWIQFIFWTCIS